MNSNPTFYYCWMYNLHSVFADLTWLVGLSPCWVLLHVTGVRTEARVTGICLAQWQVGLWGRTPETNSFLAVHTSLMLEGIFQEWNFIYWILKITERYISALGCNQIQFLLRCNDWHRYFYHYLEPVVQWMAYRSVHSLAAAATIDVM